MENKVLIKQFKNKAKKPVAGLTPEHAIYDTNGVRLDAKLGTVNLSEFRKAQDEGIKALKNQEKESLKILREYDHETIINNGTINNAADEEDITVRDNVLSFKDRTYTEGVNEMGYIILRKNKSFAEQVIKENTIYEIRYDFILNENVTIPANCVLKFNGGSIDSGNITLNNTEIIGSYYCLRENLNLLGTHNDIDLAWLGICGNNPNNSSRFNLIEGKNYYFKSDIVFNTGDLEIPAKCKIDGRNNKMRFTCESATKGLVRLVGGNPILENIIFEVGNASFDGVIISVDTTDSFYGSFCLRNLEIWGTWFSNQDYKSTAIKIYCSNEKENTAFNYITGCQINNILIRNANIGIDITNRAENYDDSTYFAWLNEIYIINPIIHAKSIGIKTTYINNTVHNPPASVGPIYVNNYEFQALNTSALMCKHSGRWPLYITQAYAYDCTLLGKVLNYGSLYFTRVFGNTAINETGTDDDGEYTQNLGVRIYSNAYFQNNIVPLTSYISFANSNYSPKSGTQIWSINNNGDNLNISSADTHKKSIIFKGDGNVFTTCHETNSYIYYKTEKRGTLGSPIIFEYFNNYGANSNFTLTKIERRSTKLTGCSIRECIGCSEVYVKGIPNVTINTIVVVKIKLLFLNNPTYTAYKANTFGFLNEMFSLRYVSANNADILKKSLVKENDDIFVVIKAKITETASSCIFNFDIAYNPALTRNKEIVVDSNGYPDIKITDKDFVYGVDTPTVTVYKLLGPFADKPSGVEVGFVYFNTDTHKNITYGGSNKWYNSDGTEASA